MPGADRCGTGWAGQRAQCSFGNIKNENMLKNTIANIKTTIKIAGALGELNDKVIFVGGAMVALFNPTYLGVTLSLQISIKWNDFDKMRPAQLSRQCRDNFRIGVTFVKLDHSSEAFFSIAIAVLLCQLL
jgi:hypothetical protein